MKGYTICILLLVAVTAARVPHQRKGHVKKDAYDWNGGNEKHRLRRNFPDRKPRETKFDGRVLPRNTRHDSPRLSLARGPIHFRQDKIQADVLPQRSAITARQYHVARKNNALRREEGSNCDCPLKNDTERAERFVQDSQEETTVFQWPGDASSTTEDALTVPAGNGNFGDFAQPWSEEIGTSGTGETDDAASITDIPLDDFFNDGSSSESPVSQNPPPVGENLDDFPFEDSTQSEDIPRDENSNGGITGDESSDSTQSEDIPRDENSNGEVTGEESSEKCNCVPVLQCGVTYRVLIRPEDFPCSEDEVCCTIPVDDYPNPGQTTCGFAKPNRNVRGSEGGLNRALYGEYPWTVVIKLNSSPAKVICAGTLIHPQVVLTAANCVANFSIDRFTVHAGLWDLDENTELPIAPQTRIIATRIAHNSFRNGLSLSNNIALILLSEPFQLNDAVNTICLATNLDQVDLDHCVGAGWGKEPQGSEPVKVMKKVPLPIVSRSDCQALLRKTHLGYTFKLGKSLLCAGGNEGVDMCLGDGGGPLMCPDISTGEMKQVGITAGGVGCGKRGIPGFYSDVTVFNFWIQENLLGLLSDVP